MRLYVGGLPYQTTEQELISLFEQAGQVSSATVIMDRETGRSKGFGFVEMDNPQDAQYAMERLNGSTLGNRTITVNEARERPAGGGGGGNRGGGYQNGGGGRRYGGNRGGDRDRY
ncbi:RNA recognition motif domain-containing protein [Tengunoibacter tsumagoiensis]|uniref:RRM domain-containing protein n=1 Tax=Tengunoibacter tsumagoiensis TaxID=2014871 RepID=A0A401ZX42_9CHLR|nr:RNA-binding protein [Tengunoibacter tsumagoiensis]GCE11416.1 hypothetical protein KTT_12750 [Tengunoibacter tsumagoiensis]